MFHSKCFLLVIDDFLVSNLVFFLFTAPQSVLSVGWTTPIVLEDAQCYGKEEIDCMKSVVQQLPNSQATLVTYAVRAKLMISTDLDYFERNLLTSPNSTLTVWTSIADELNDTDLLYLKTLRTKYGSSRVFYDLPCDHLSF